MTAPRKAPDAETHGIYRMDTIPPPDGEADPYGAPTKVGPMARTMIDKMMADAAASEPGDSDVTALFPTPPPTSGPRPSPGVYREIQNVGSLRHPEPAAEIPRLFEDSEDGDLFDPTSLRGVAGTPQQSGATKLLDRAIITEAIVSLTPRSAGRVSVRPEVTAAVSATTAIPATPPAVATPPRVFVAPIPVVGHPQPAAPARAPSEQPVLLIIGIVVFVATAAVLSYFVLTGL